MNLTKPITLALVLWAAGSGLAEAREYRASNGLRAAAQSDGTFIVFGNAPSGGSATYCAAGEFALKRLGAGFTDKIYTIEGRKRGSDRWTFSLSPSGLSPARYLSLTESLRQPGGFISVGQANDYCEDLFRRVFP